MTSSEAPRRGLLDHLSRIVLGLAGAALLAMALVQAWQVFARYVLNDSPGWTEPVALILMSVAVMFGAAVGVRYETHFAFQTLAHSMPGPIRSGLASLSRLIAAATGLGLATMGGYLMLDDWTVPLAGAPLPSGLKFLGLAVGGVLILIFALERLFTGAPKPVRED